MIKTCILVLSISLLVSANMPMSACTAGRMTYFNYGSDGACSFGALDGSTGVYIAAPNQAYFNNAAQCGICYEVTGKTGTVTIMVADECPVSGNEEWCSGDMTHFDMNEPAFQAAGILSDGVEYMTFREVSCPVSGNIGITIKDGSSVYWFGLLITNHRVGVTTVEVQPSGTSQWTSLARQSYNYFLWTTGTMTLPMQVRITAVTGEQVITSISAINPSTSVTTDVQFSEVGSGYTGSSSTPCVDTAYSSSSTGSNSVTSSSTTSATVSTSTTAAGTTAVAGTTASSGVISDVGTDILQSGLISGWQDWSWGVSNSWTDAGVTPGTTCLTSSMTAWGGVQLASYPTGADVSSTVGISFYVKTNSGTYNQLSMAINEESSTAMMITGITTEWQKYFVPWLDLGGNPGTLNQIAFQNFQSSSAVLYFDSITLVSQYNGGGVPWNPNDAVMYGTTSTTGDASKVTGFAVLTALLVALLL